MNSRIKKGEWVVLFCVTGIIDVGQILIDLFFSEFLAAPEVINDVLDPVIGAFLLVYFQLRGVHMFQRLNRLISILGVTAIGDFTGGIASLWVLDVWYIYSDVKKEKAEAETSQAEENSYISARQALNIDGRRKPAEEDAELSESPEQADVGRNANTNPLNIQGVRRPTP